jgi:hypothetical protein
MISVNSPRTGAASKWVRRAAAGPRRISSISQAPFNPAGSNSQIVTLRTLRRFQIGS